nr:peptidylprolyl isomerase [Allobaculum mucilyticum]
MKVKGYDTPIVFTMDEGIAPESVDNFVSLADSGFYDGLTFHRIMEGFMIQGGDPRGDGTGGSSHQIYGEFAENGFDNSLEHVRGTVSMARSSDPDSASSQFFIVQDDSQFLDGQYAAFGTVVSGMEVVDEIAETAKPTDNNGSITKSDQPVIESITIEEVDE